MKLWKISMSANLQIHYKYANTTIWTYEFMMLWTYMEMHETTAVGYGRYTFMWIWKTKTLKQYNMETFEICHLIIFLWVFPRFVDVDGLSQLLHRARNDISRKTGHPQRERVGDCQHTTVGSAFTKLELWGDGIPPRSNKLVVCHSPTRWRLPLVQKARVRHSQKEVRSYRQTNGDVDTVSTTWDETSFGLW